MNDHSTAIQHFRALVRDSLHDLGWPKVRIAMLLGLAFSVWSATVFAFPLRQFAQTGPLELFVLGGAIADQIKALCLLVAIVVADHAVDQGARRYKTYLLAALVGCTVGILLSEPLFWAWRTFVLPDLWPANRPWLGGPLAPVYYLMFNFTHWLLVSGTVVFLYADRRAARKTEQLLHAAELDRIRRSKLALESKLQAMQARVEPQFLFNTLDQVERLYESDPAIAARMLDDLIAYLRAAMPLMRNTSSTVAQEIELVRTYLDIVRIRLGERLAFQIDVPPGADSVRMPPMMLLPLVDHAIVRGLEPSNAAGTIRIGTEVSDGRLRLRIADSGAGFVPETGGDGIADIRERLSALYGGDGRLDLRRQDAGSTEAVLDLPLEAAEDAGATATPRGALPPP